MKARTTAVRLVVLSYIARNPGCSTADVDRACRTARGGHKWMYATVDRAARAGLVRSGRSLIREESRRGGAAGLVITPAGEAMLAERAALDVYRPS